MKRQMMLSNFLLSVVGILAIQVYSQAQNSFDKRTAKSVSTKKTVENITVQKNYLNTATAEKAGKQYSLMLVGDLLPSLYVDNRKILKQDLEEYTDIIDSLSTIIWQRQRMEDGRRSATTIRAKQQILQELVQKKYLASTADAKSFYLTDREFFINGKLQNANAFVYFKNKYIKSEDKALYYEKSFTKF